MYKETLSAFIEKKSCYSIVSFCRQSIGIFIIWTICMCPCGKHKGSLYKKLERFTDWFTQEDPAEEYIFFHFKWISVSCAVIINKVLKVEESAWFYKIWSKVKLKEVHVFQQVLSTCLVLVPICLMHPEKQLSFKYLTFTLLFIPFRNKGFSIKEAMV